MSTILITGCSTGIGFATAERMARSGHTVYATMRTPQKSPELVQLAERDNLPITILSMDVDSDESVKATVAEVLTQAGQIDVLVNNAGIAPISAVEETAFGTFQAVMQTNYFGTLRCIQAVLPGMRQWRSGCIVNVSSVAGKIYSACFGAYCATKAAIEALSESLAGEVSQYGIRVALVQPGVIDTPLIEKGDAVPPQTAYYQHARLKAYLAASASFHVPASEVAETILAVATGEKADFRNPVGADALPLLGWRASLSDEEWIGTSNLDEETWIAGMAQMGMDVRPHLETFSAVV